MNDAAPCVILMTLSAVMETASPKNGSVMEMMIVVITVMKKSVLDWS